mgnify:CR=1 FL=1
MIRRHIALIILIAVTFSSCQYFGIVTEEPEDEQVDKTEKKDDQTEKIDPETYNPSDYSFQEQVVYFLTREETRKELGRIYPYVRIDNIEKDDSAKNSWFDEQEPYRSSFIVKPKMETNFEDCKRKFRRELRMNLSKQNAIELGWLLLKKLRDSDFEKVRKTSSPDDDLVEALKEVIEEYY